MTVAELIKVLEEQDRQVVLYNTIANSYEYFNKYITGRTGSYDIDDYLLDDIKMDLVTDELVKGGYTLEDFCFHGIKVLVLSD